MTFGSYEMQVKAQATWKSPCKNEVAVSVLFCSLQSSAPEKLEEVFSFL